MQSSYDSKIASSQQDSNSRLKGRDAGETARSVHVGIVACGCSYAAAMRIQRPWRDLKQHT